MGEVDVLKRGSRKGLELAGTNSISVGAGGRWEVLQPVVRGDEERCRDLASRGFSGPADDGISLEVG